MTCRDKELPTTTVDGLEMAGVEIIVEGRAMKLLSGLVLWPEIQIHILLEACMSSPSNQDRAQ